MSSRKKKKCPILLNFILYKSIKTDEERKFGEGHYIVFLTISSNLIEYRVKSQAPPQEIIISNRHLLYILGVETIN